MFSGIHRNSFNPNIQLPIVTGIERGSLILSFNGGSSLRIRKKKATPHRYEQDAGSMSPVYSNTLLASRVLVLDLPLLH